ncbi:MAG: DUF1800 domain-containing protein [Xanthobacteraceae bacterium]
MTIDPRAQAALALHRFGMGPRQNSIAAIAEDPRGALLADLERPDAGRIPVGQLPGSAEAARALFDFRAERAAQAKLAQRAKKEAEAQRMAQGLPAEENAMAGETPAVPNPERAQEPPLPRQLFLNEATARVDAAVGADIGFAERLVWFWSNHFCISADKITSMAGPYEREAIRANTLGRFTDLLLAVDNHPAMLFYLDNTDSIGPNSVAGINRDRGLNENLAREILELHTLGVRSGYTQTDVTSFAKVITGWTWIGFGADPDHGGEFVFNKRLHEPGEQTVVGKVYPDTGVEQGRAVLRDLAHHPATAAHLAYKLARYFLADEPPQPLVEKLAATYRDTDGDLKEMAKALVTAPEAWEPQRTKLKPPSEWVISTLRLTGAKPAIPRILQAQASLGEPLWRPPAPNGFPDQASAWIDGLSRRLDIASEFSSRIPDNLEPAELLDAGLGPLASTQTRQTIARAESRAQALTMLLMAPEFLRR